MILNFSFNWIYHPQMRISLLFQDGPSGDGKLDSKLFPFKYTAGKKEELSTIVGDFNKEAEYLTEPGLT